MRAVSRTLFDAANDALPQSARGNPRSANSVITMVMDRIRVAVKNAASTKAAMWLADMGDLSAAQSYRVMMGEQNFSGPVMVHLLRSQDGYRFLKAIMDGADAQWWREIDRGQRLVEIQKREAEIRRDKKRLEDEA